MWVNADLIFGDSGGAVINYQGQLVDMSSAIYDQGPAHMGVAVPVETLRSFMKQYLPASK
jgi:S1-C subfamily serine protease